MGKNPRGKEAVEEEIDQEAMRKDTLENAIKNHAINNDLQSGEN